LGIFLGIFFGVDSGWASLGFAIPFQIYAYLVIGYLIWSIIYEYRQPNLHSPVIPFVELVMLYLYLVVHNTMIYGGIALVDEDTFIGITSDMPRSVILKNTFFLSTETTAALGNYTTNCYLYILTLYQARVVSLQTH